MAYEEEDEELKALLAKKRAELERMIAAEKAREEQLRAELEREEILRHILTEEARERLSRLRLARPDFVRALEDQLIALAQAGRIKIPINDDELKEILRRLSSRRREGGITIKRKGVT